MGRVVWCHQELCRPPFLWYPKATFWGRCPLPDAVPEMRFKRTRLKRKGGGGEAVYTQTAANTNTNQKICANRVWIWISLKMLEHKDRIKCPMSSGHAGLPSLHCGVFYDQAPMRGLTSCKCYIKHHHRNDQLQQNYQNMFLTQNGSVVLTHGAFLQKERAACLTTLRANGRTPSWPRKASAGCWCKQHTIWSWEPSNSNSTPVTHTRNASSHDCITLLLPKIFLEWRGVPLKPQKLAYVATLLKNKLLKGGWVFIPLQQNDIYREEGLRSD